MQDLLLPPILAIIGPTATGKTNLALHLSEILPIEIISLDSALVYRDMNIGTAKPTTSERAIVPHHLIDIISPLENYSAANFVADCQRLVQQIHARGNIPLIVGGTMMYFSALVSGLNQLPEASTEIRAKLLQQKATHGLAYLYQQLQSVDATTASRLNPSDSQRIERALEIWLTTGKPMSEHLTKQPETFIKEYTLKTIALVPQQRALLHHYIEKRWEKMLQLGFIEEVKYLQQTYPELTIDMPSMRCVGYRQVWSYLLGEINQSVLSQQGVAATRQLAKRQLTWLRKLPIDYHIDPFDSNLLPEITRIAKQVWQSQ